MLTTFQKILLKLVLKCYIISKNSLESGLEMSQALTQYSISWSWSFTVLLVAITNEMQLSKGIYYSTVH